MLTLHISWKICGCACFTCFAWPKAFLINFWKCFQFENIFELNCYKQKWQIHLTIESCIGIVMWALQNVTIFDALKCAMHWCLHVMPEQCWLFEIAQMQMLQLKWINSSIEDEWDWILTQLKIQFEILCMNGLHFPFIDWSML